MKKMFKILLIIVVFTTTFIGVIPSVSAKAPASVQAGDAERLTPHIGGVSFSYKTLSNGEYAYCLEVKKGLTQNIKANLVGELDAGYAYIVANGYPNKKITGNRNYDYSITQIALWLYMDETSGTDNLASGFRNNASDPYNLMSHVIKLTDAAKAAKAKGYAKPSISLSTPTSSMSISEDGKYFISNPITLGGTSVSSPKVSIVSSPEGTIITDEEGTEKKEFKIGDKFLLKTPVESVTGEDVTINIKTSGTGTVYKAYEYSPVNNNMQNIVPQLIPVSTAVADEASFDFSTTTVVINKTDASTKNYLAGAELVIKKDGVEIDRITTTGEKIEIKNLGYGNYTIEEVKAPNGYELTTKIYEFTLSEENPTAEVTIENFPTIEVPNTSSSSTLLLSLIGFLIISFSAGIIYRHAKAKN